MPAKLATHNDPMTALDDFCSGPLAPAEAVRGVVALSPDRMPQPYRRLLVHHGHMTETLRSHHGREVALKVLAARQDGDSYQRRIILTLADSDRVVEIGLVRIHLQFTDEDVRRRILARQTPLGDILIRANVLRRIEPRWYYRFDGACPLLADFDRRITDAYGRLGTIYCNRQPAIELLEIVSDGDA